MYKPKVMVLMATYNGIVWLPDQIQSILHQEGVEISLAISDDQSGDATYDYLKNISAHDNRVNIFPRTKRFGSAGNNFYNLIITADIGESDYVAFADQDDIWDASKLINHINIAKQHNADGVSSNVMAFWPDGKQKLIVKSNPQKKWDYLFESSGPGCTFLMTPWLVKKVREQLLNDSSLARKVVLHDWLTYAICRAYGRKWVIDDSPSVKYRQHKKNVVGANVGLLAKWARMKKIKKSWYRQEVLKLVNICNGINHNEDLDTLSKLLKERSLLSRLSLYNYVSEARRKRRDRCFLALSIITGIF